MLTSASNSVTSWDVPTADSEGDDMSKAFAEMFTAKNLEFKTDLTIEEIRSISLVLFLAEYLKLPEYKAFITRVMKLKVSKDRKGRKEAENILAGNMNKNMNELELRQADLENRLSRGR